MNKFTVYECKHCGRSFIKEDWDDLDYLEEALWGHIQMDHEEIFDEIQDLETPDMIEEVYERRFEWPINYRRGDSA